MQSSAECFVFSKFAFSPPSFVSNHCHHNLFPLSIFDSTSSFTSTHHLILPSFFFSFFILPPWHSSPAYFSVDGDLSRPWLMLAQPPPPLYSLWWWGSLCCDTEDCRHRNRLQNTLASALWQTLGKDTQQTDRRLSRKLCLFVTMRSFVWASLTSLLCLNGPVCYVVKAVHFNMSSAMDPVASV